MNPEEIKRKYEYHSEIWDKFDYEVKAEMLADINDLCSYVKELQEGIRKFYSRWHTTKMTGDEELYDKLVEGKDEAGGD